MLTMMFIKTICNHLLIAKYTYNMAYSITRKYIITPSTNTPYKAH